MIPTTRPPITIPIDPDTAATSLLILFFNFPVVVVVDVSEDELVVEEDDVDDVDDVLGE